MLQSPGPSAGSVPSVLMFVIAFTHDRLRQWGTALGGGDGEGARVGAPSGPQDAPLGKSCAIKYR